MFCSIFWYSWSSSEAEKAELIFQGGFLSGLEREENRAKKQNGVKCGGIYWTLANWFAFFFSLWWRNKGKKVMSHLFYRLFRSFLPWNSSQKKISFLLVLFGVFSMHRGAFCLEELRESDASG